MAKNELEFVDFFKKAGFEELLSEGRTIIAPVNSALPKACLRVEPRPQNATPDIAKKLIMGHLLKMKSLDYHWGDGDTVKALDGNTLHVMQSEGAHGQA